MDRRTLFKISLAGAAGAMLPAVANAKTGVMAGGVYFTDKNPGRWAKKIGGHFPQVKKMAGGKLKVVTSHEMNGFKHYIVKHVVLDDNYDFIAEKMFDPNTDKVAISTFDLKGYQGKVHVLSVCNKHDTWVNSMTV